MNKHFIKATPKMCLFEEHIPAPYLRRTFILDVLPEKAVLSICGLGFYRLYINGIEITKGHIAPYISNPDHICYYDEYDLKNHLLIGKNVIGIILGNGMLNQFGGVVWGFDKAEWRSSPSVAFEFYAEDKDGNKIEFIADNAVKVSPSPILFDDFRMGEFYDARKEIEFWNMPEFDDSEWKNAINAEIPRGKLKLCKAEPIKTEKEISAVAITRKDTGYLYDFGVNSAGVCKLKINAENGQKIILWHGEILENGDFSNKNIIYNRENTQFYKEYSQKDVYIANGKGEEIYIPSFTYHGFRYVLVEGIKEKQATKELLTFQVMHSTLKEIGTFRCSDDTINTLFDMVKRSDMSNFFYFPTDCPHREKNGWTGDASASAEQMILLYDVKASWSEWLSNIRLAQDEEGRFPGIVPTAGWGYEWGNGPAWDSVIFNLPYELYKKQGITDEILNNASAIMRYLEYISRKRNSDGTVSIGLGDWVPVGRKNSDYQSPLKVTDSIIVMDMARKAVEMFRAVGFNNEAVFAENIYKDMRNAIRSNLLNKDTMCILGNCQTSQAMGLYYGVFEKNEEKQAFEMLKEFIHLNGDRFDCGFLGLRVLFHVLSKYGDAELAYKMLTQKGYPSYRHLIDVGETTLPEQFMPDGVSCGSHNHHFLGDIANWFMTEIAGIHIINCENIKIKPNFINSIKYAEASYDLPKGKVSVFWERKDGQIFVRIKSPVKYEFESSETVIFN